jgi:PhoD-like phosphatase
MIYILISQSTGSITGNDSHLQSLLRNTSMYSQLDDHEVLNDYGGNWTYYNDPDTKGFQNMVKEGVNAFFNFSPIERNSNEHNRIYRSFHWGKDLVRCIYITTDQGIHFSLRMLPIFSYDIDHMYSNNLDNSIFHVRYG